MNDTLVLQIYFGGLGDHLFYSHIPRIAKETGAYKKVYISNRSPFRSQEYKALIWELNPYVDGFIDAAGITNRVYGKLDPAKENLLDLIMLDFGLDDGKRFHEPEVYYTPVIKPDLAQTALYDPNYVSRIGFFDSRDLEKVVRERGFVINAQMALRDRNVPLSSIRRTVSATSLKDFCSIIASCKEVYCLTSGTATLAAALGKPATIFYGVGQPRVFHHSKLHQYVFVPERPSRKFVRRASGLISIIKKQLFAPEQND
ncbi:MAG: hypothetical protein KGI71_02455 [Patescibacteria group bacterium]|nr:hypothetical protein [Patescibacteria group bacterium]